MEQRVSLMRIMIITKGLAGKTSPNRHADKIRVPFRPEERREQTK